ncbi:MAG: hypothetical protein ACKO7W_23050 [Elainella sp.]
MQTSFWIWLSVLLGLASFGLGTMISAYWGKGSVAVVFPAPVGLGEPVSTVNSEAASQFQQGCDAYQAGQYRQATARFQTALELDSDLAEAQHNLARATANLRRVTEAIAELVKASELYSRQGNGAMLAQLKQDLETLRR